MSKVPNPYGNTCQVTLELSWEVAEAFVRNGPALIAALSDALDARKQDARHNGQVRALLDKQCEDNKAEWAALAQYCEVEIARRSNGKGQRPRIVKQLAVELKVAPSFLNTICSVYTAEARKAGIEQRQAQIVRLYFLGRTNSEIAREVRLHPQTVAQILANAKPTLALLKASVRDYERLKDAARGAGASV